MKLIARRMSDISCWVVSDGRLGMENQCLGLAEALGVDPVVKRISNRFPWRYLPPQVWVSPLSAPGRSGDSLARPWPDLLIASGRQTVGLSAAVQRLGGGRSFTVQIQNPVVNPRYFGLVVAPRHDRLEGENVVETDGALHRVTPERLKREAARIRDRLAALPRPLIAVMVGGANRQYRLTPARIRKLGDGLARLVRDHGAGLVVTPSRRTGARNEAILRECLAGLPAEIWNGAGDNPIFGYLGWADAVVVTGDSVSMVSEACATGKPVYVFDLEGNSEKFDRFHHNLRDRGYTRPFRGKLEFWRYAPLDDMQRVTDEIRRRIAVPA